MKCWERAHGGEIHGDTGGEAYSKEISMDFLEWVCAKHEAPTNRACQKMSLVGGSKSHKNGLKIMVAIKFMNLFKSTCSVRHPVHAHI